MTEPAVDPDTRTMRVMVCRAPGEPLHLETRRLPAPAEHQVLVRVEACAVCRTDLHVRDGELPDIPYPVVPGHQVVGTVAAAADGAVLKTGQRVGVTWLGWTCGECEYCARDQENLCDRALFHGYRIDGGYADFMLADARYCIPLPDGLPAIETTPLLCAGLIGFRSLRMAGDARRIGIYGFGSAAHIITQLAVHEGREIYAFTRPGDADAQSFAAGTGARWAGDSSSGAPEALDAAIIFAPVGELVPKALRDVRKGGRVICGGIHMSDIPGFPYADLWEERQIRSVANLTRRDGEDFFSRIAGVRIRPEITTYPLEQANEALEDLRRSAFNGTAVLTT